MGNVGFRVEACIDGFGFILEEAVGRNVRV